jgi:hypothetical protein
VPLPSRVFITCTHKALIYVTSEKNRKENSFNEFNEFFLGTTRWRQRREYWKMKCLERLILFLCQVSLTLVLAHTPIAMKITYNFVDGSSSSETWRLRRRFSLKQFENFLMSSFSDNLSLVQWQKRENLTQLGNVLKLIITFFPSVEINKSSGGEGGMERRMEELRDTSWIEQRAEIEMLTNKIKSF